MRTLQIIGPQTTTEPVLRAVGDLQGFLIIFESENRDKRTKNFFLGNAIDCELDASGRVLVAPELRSAAGITKGAVLLGMGNHFELWDAQTYAAQEAEAMKGEMPDVFKDFSF